MQFCRTTKEPTLEEECYSAIFSAGADCRKCQEPCYRNGWEKAAVTADNATLVRLNHSAALTAAHIMRMKAGK
jgi:hypothetical protein